MVGSTYRASVALGSILVMGCTHGSSNPLDPDVVNDLAGEPGDATGFGFSGNSELAIERDVCECPDRPQLGTVSLCALIGPEPSPLPYRVDLVQSDGYLLARLLRHSLAGRVDTDGQFSVGAVVDAASLFTTGQAITRLDGTIDRMQLELDAILQHRIVATLVDLDDGAESIDCVESFIVTGQVIPADAP